MATSRRYAKSVLLHLCDPIEMWYVLMFRSVHSVNSSHVPTVLVNHEGMCDFLSVRDHLFAIPNGSMPWLFDTIVTTLLSFDRVIMISVVKSCQLPYAPHLLHLFHRRHRTFIRSADSHRSSHLEVLFAHIWSGFMPAKRLSVAACNESAVVKSNQTFDLRDEPAGEVTTREAELVTLKPLYLLMYLPS